MKQMTMMESLIEDLDSNEPNRVSKAIDILDKRKKVANPEVVSELVSLATSRNGSVSKHGTRESAQKLLVKIYGDVEWCWKNNENEHSKKEGVFYQVMRNVWDGCASTEGIESSKYMPQYTEVNRDALSMLNRLNKTVPHTTHLSILAELLVGMLLNKINANDKRLAKEMLLGLIPTPQEEDDTARQQYEYSITQTSAYDLAHFQKGKEQETKRMVSFVMGLLLAPSRCSYRAGGPHGWHLPHQICHQIRVQHDHQEEDLVVKGEGEETVTILKAHEKKRLRIIQNDNDQLLLPIENDPNYPLPTNKYVRDVIDATRRYDKAGEMHDQFDEFAKYTEEQWKEHEEKKAENEAHHIRMMMHISDETSRQLVLQTLFELGEPAMLQLLENLKNVTNQWKGETEKRQKVTYNVKRALGGY
tara:strand:+ start:36 stop:1286 length:1251 start_codon:yes stop_codon:yes gene_type:complete